MQSGNADVRNTFHAVPQEGCCDGGFFRDRQIASGVPAAQAYSTTMSIMAALLVVGFVANLLVRPVAEKFWAENRTPAPSHD